MKHSPTIWAGAALLTATMVLGCGDDDPAMTGSGGSGGTSSGGMSSGGMSSGGDGGSGGDGATCNTDVCTTYGAAVPQVSSDVVDAAAADPMFMDDFAPLVNQGQPAVDDFKESLANFISDAYGCTDGAYTGPSMEDAHTGLDITQEEYDAFIGLIADVLADNGVPADDINNCFAPPLVDPAFANTMIGK